jgi:CRP-like cAMP-binding protein
MMASLRGLARAGLVFLERQPPDTWLLPPRQPPDCRPEASTLELAERILWMDQAMYFANSRVDAVADIARISKDVRWSAGAPLWRRGEDADGFVLVISGEVEISYTTGRALASVGQTLGGIESLADLPHWYDAVATTPVRALHSTRDAILDVIEDQADLGVDMVRFLAARLLRLRGGAST